ncbi:MAG: MFS transporter [Clostridiales Family XIII bacterium]|nr:MFS transporter [Clostridiales Family XIII bacterium]
MRESRNGFGRKGWSVVIFVGLLFMISIAAADLLNVSPKLFEEAYGWDANGLLAYSSVGGWLGVAATMFFGQWVAAKGAKTPTVIFLFVFAALYFLNGQVKSVAAYGIVVILLMAVCNCLNLVSTNTYMSNWFHRKKGIALGFAAMGIPACEAVLVPLFAWVARVGGGIGEPFTVISLITAAIALLAIFIIRATPEEAGTRPDNDPPEASAQNVSDGQSAWTVGMLLRSRQMWLVSIVFGLFMINSSSTMTQFVPRVMAAGSTMTEGTLWLAVSSVVGVLGNYIIGSLDQKFGTKATVIGFGVYLAAMQFLLAAATGSKAGTMILAVMTAVLVGGVFNLLPSMIMQIFGPPEFASVNRVVTPVVVALRNVTFVLMACVLGATGGSYRALSIVLGCMTIVAILLALRLSNRMIGAPTVSRGHKTDTHRLNQNRPEGMTNEKS